MLTGAFALLGLVLRVDVFRLCDPVQVTHQILLQLLLLTQLLEVSAGLGLFSLLGKLSDFIKKYTGILIKNKIYTVYMYI